ncbi:MAG: glycoside hydrolase family 2 protein, partial [Blautia sp.]|nr:glycoside hydrolase family 2 protein [Blautia sp.]
MRKLSFNEDWVCNGVPVTLPHDAQILEKRDPEGNGGHGYFPGGIYTYEKCFEAPVCWEGKKVIAEFEGVYKNASVSLNGERLAFHPYGYTTFTVELKGLRYGEKNTLTVEADNSKLPNSRWYSGAGIYRPVWLYIGGEGDIAYRGVKITTLAIHPAKIRVETMVCGGQASVGEVSVEILDGEKAIASGSGADCELAVPDAGLWSEEVPKLYTCRVSTGSDAVEEKFGIREITWSNKGLFINGKETLLRGGCIHHDNGILGAATYDESEWRRVRILKEAGFNALRASHNPASRALLEACDFYGMYVMDETFDMWYNRKNKYDYGCDFEKCWQEDTAEMVARDYNHPSVILYSIGNEVAEPSQEKGLQYAKKMSDLCRRMDKTRPVSCGLNLMIMSRAVKGNGIYQDGEMEVKADTGKQKKQDGKQNASLAFNIMASFIGSGMNNAANSAQADKIAAPVMELLDIAGYNYASGRYQKEGKLHPDRVIFGSETFPQDICKNWAMVKEYPYLVGDFMWTAWDYLGEAGLGAWSYTGGMPFNRPYPWVLAGTGVIDICGTPDGSCRYASTVWGLEKAPRIAVKPVNHPGERVSKSVWRGTNAIESWSWDGCDGNRAEIEVYSDSASVALLLNGKPLGKKKIKDCKAVFKTGYAPGTLTAVAYSADGRELARNTLSSASGRV